MEIKKVSDFRGFLRDIGSIGKVAKWAFEMADSPLARKYFYQKYAIVIVLVFITLLPPAVISYIFTGLVEKDVHKVWVSIFVLGAISVLVRFAIYLFWRVHEHLFGHAYANIHRRITEKFLEKSIHQHKEIKGLNHESLAKGKNRIYDICVEHLCEALEVVSIVFVSYVFIWIISPVAGLFVSALLLIYLSWSLYLNYRAIKVCPVIEEEFTSFERYMASRWKFAERVVVSAKEDDEIIEMDHRWFKIVEKDRSFWLWHLKRATARDFVSVFVEISIIIYGTKMVMSGEWASVGILYPLYSWTNTIVSNIWRIGQMQRNIMGYIPTIQVMMETLETPPSVVDHPESVDLNSSGPLELSFQNVSYSYGKESEGEGTIKNVSFTVSKGERVALVGPSGSGKSTLQYLALRFMDTSSGMIMANQKDLKGLTLKSWRKAVAYVPQKPQIFDGTVRENLVYSLTAEEMSHWTDEKLLKLMKTLAIDFGKRPEGESPLDIVVGREGVQLSGGQSQRLAIGTAVIKRPRFMLIDEATSHLDSTTEKAVLEGLGELVTGISTLVIAHRLSTVESADKIVVLVGGKVEAVGSGFQDLFLKSPTFRRLAKDQNIELC